VRRFCGACGTPLTYEHADFAGEVDVTAASLDEPAAFPPADHTWWSERVAWLALDDGRPRFLRSRSGGAAPDGDGLKQLTNCAGAGRRSTRFL
jgi:hypothetical protein